MASSSGSIARVLPRCLAPLVICCFGSMQGLAAEPPGLRPPADADLVARVEGKFVSALLDAFHWDLVQALDADGIEQRDWTSDSGRDVRLHFSGGQLGSSLCSATSFSYALLNRHRIWVGIPRSELAGCGGESLMRLQSRVVRQLTGLDAYALRMEDGAEPPRLDLVFRDASRWQLKGVPISRMRH
ncbi:hypothetical protein G7047_14855 [Diaphorobacter sp. HDW4A]|uniref:hypothetical protein n=1 Tax=Diaphorobacter sp. HDW4A TaxID=2714924 RepID=UPI0014088F91|nr:hypothetical protein [Diaphorobacter sp. HDW4A]QIL81035.1 hypothetical protein G7047_14855 [Diaphorobacter sp. HDW4A]